MSTTLHNNIHPSQSWIFDAFFWIEPVKMNKKKTATKVLWHFPEDVSAIVRDFSDLADFCFPDLQRVNLEKPQNSRTEHYTFTLTNSSGVRYYGICMRGLFRGVSRRFDVKRRTRHCLCFITRYPFFRMFKNLLLELHAIALLEEIPGCCRQFIDYFYRKCVINDFTSLKEQHILIPHSTVAALFHDVSILRPRISNSSSSSSSSLGMSSKEVPLLPLFDSLGVERFFKLLSAVLCENRILFISDEAETLSSTVLAAVTLLHPFKWHHTFIPLLPDNLLSYISKTSPYMIGMRRYLVNELKKEYLEGVVTVDIESGEVRLHGSGTIRDIIGDSSTTLKQASESLDQMKAKMSSMFYGSAKPSGTTATVGGGGGGDKKVVEHGGPKDIMLTVISDLRSMIVSTKPGSTLSSMLKGGRSLEEAKMQWSIESEKVIKDCLSCFFVYLVGNLEDFVIPAALLSSSIKDNSNNNNSGSSSSSSGFGTVVTAEPPKTFVGIGNKSNTTITGNNDNKLMNATSYLKAYGPEDSRSKFDLKAFVHKRIQLGDSKNIVAFVSDFINSEIFEKYCTELFQRLCGSDSGSGSNKRQSTVEFRTTLKPTVDRNVKSMPTSSSILEYQNSDTKKRLNFQQAEDPEDIFDAACIELKNREQAWSISNVKAMVAYCSSSALQLSSDSSNNNSSNSSSTKEMGSHFHFLTVQYTTGAVPLASFELEAEKDSAYYTGIFNSSSTTTVITTDARDVSKRVMIENNVKKIVAESCNSECFVKIMSTIGFRLQSCLAATCRGASGISGIRALILCRCLLIEGPECVLSYAVDFISTLRELLMVRQMQDSSSKQQQAIDYMALGAAVDATAHSKQVLDLILDHKKLLNQRKVFVLLKNGSLSFLSQRLPSGELVATTHVKKDHLLFLNPSFSPREFASFKNLHESMNVLKLRSVSANVVRTTVPELASGLVESPDDGDDDDDDDYEGSTSKIAKKRSSIAMPPSQRSNYNTDVADDASISSKINYCSDAVSLIQSTSAASPTTTTTTTTTIANNSTTAPINTALPKPSKPAKPMKNVKVTPVSSTDSLVNVVDADLFQSRSSTTTTGVVINSTTSIDSFAPFYDSLSSGTNIHNTALSTTATTTTTATSTSDPFASDPFGSTAVLSPTSTIPMHRPVGTNTTAFISTTRPPGSTSYVRPADGKVESKDPFASLNPMLG